MEYNRRHFVLELQQPAACMVKSLPDLLPSPGSHSESILFVHVRPPVLTLTILHSPGSSLQASRCSWAHKKYKQTNCYNTDAALCALRVTYEIFSDTAHHTSPGYLMADISTGVALNNINTCKISNIVWSLHFSLLQLFHRAVDLKFWGHSLRWCCIMLRCFCYFVYCVNKFAW